MENCILDFNALSGSLTLTSLPESLHCLALNHNRFSGDVVVKPRDGQQIYLYVNEYDRVVNEAGQTIEHCSISE